MTSICKWSYSFCSQMFPPTRSKPRFLVPRVDRVVIKEITAVVGDTSHRAVHQWGTFDIPALKLRESLLRDVCRWKAKQETQSDQASDDSLTFNIEKAIEDGDVMAKEENTPDDPIRFSLRRKVCICTAIVLMTAMR